MKFKYILSIILTILLTIFLLARCTSIKKNFLSSANSYDLNNNKPVNEISNDDSNECLSNNKENKELDNLDNSDTVDSKSHDDSIPKAEHKLDKIIPAIDEVVGEYKDNIALYYYNFDSAESYCFNEDRYYLSASLRKIPLVMQVLDKVNAGELSLDTLVEYQEVDYAGGTGVLQDEDYIGSRPIKELIELSMTESDNIAFNMLNRLCGYTLIEYTNNLLGPNCMIEEDGYIKLTAKHNFEIMYNLYTNPNNNPYYNMVIEALKDTAFNDSINKYLPEGTVAHKIGSFYRSYHDSGIIFGDETYILVILTRDVGTLSNSSEFTEEQEERILVDWGKEAFELIANVSKAIYDIVSSPNVGE